MKVTCSQEKRAKERRMRAVASKEADRSTVTGKGGKSLKRAPLSHVFVRTLVIT